MARFAVATKTLPVAGDRVKWVSLDPFVPVEHGTITEVLPDGGKIMVLWDDDDEPSAMNYGGAGRTFLASVNKRPGEL